MASGWLTFMPTLMQLVDSEALIRVNVLESDDLPSRCLYATPDFVDWLENTLSELVEDPIYGDLSPYEQVYAMFAEYVSGSDFSSDRRFRKMSSTPEYWVWEMKTVSIRIFGWVPNKDCFICCYGDEADKIKFLDSYNTYIAKTFYVRNQLPLDPPKYVAGGQYEQVISI